jgi:hypothetical protein
VDIVKKHSKPWIKVSPLGKQEEPENLVALKAEMERRWGTIHLIDILKEAEFATGFTSEFTSVATRDAVPKAVLRRRLLLVLPSTRRGDHPPAQPSARRGHAARGPPYGRSPRRPDHRLLQLTPRPGHTETQVPLSSREGDRPATLGIGVRSRPGSGGPRPPLPSRVIQLPVPILLRGRRGRHLRSPS